MKTTYLQKVGLLMMGYGLGGLMIGLETVLAVPMYIPIGILYFLTLIIYAARKDLQYDRSGNY